MVVLIVVAVACFAAGTFAAVQWLPELESGVVGGIAFFGLCGLSGAVLALLGINVYSIVRGLQTSSKGLETVIVSQGLVSIMRDCGTVGALALIAYLLTGRQAAARDATSGDTQAASPLP